MANTENDKLVDVYQRLLNETLLDQISQHHGRSARVVLARDTRESGPALVSALKAALDVVGVQYQDYEILTTPQLHQMVRCINTKGSQNEFGEATKDGYYRKMANAFKKAMQGRNTIGPLTIDCANGVGAMALMELIPYLPQEGDPGYLDIRMINIDMDDAKALNVEVCPGPQKRCVPYVTKKNQYLPLFCSQCGADFVKTRQQAPKNWKTPGEHVRGCSLDGDADRLIYYYLFESPESHVSKGFHLMDGDRLATLGALFLMELTKQAKIDHKLSIGIIQTAYANGASTDYITNVLKLKALCVSTGVKHLHHAANRYDIGVYFEANGHGTILFSDGAKEKIRSEEPRTPGQKNALDTLSACIDLVNQAVGDALSDMLFIELVLAAKTWSMDRWEKCYIDLPNVLKRVVVKDRSIFQTTDSERQLSSPAGIQTSINSQVENYQKGRAFARASGTEDAVRVYAEAYRTRDAAELADAVATIVTRYSQGG